MKIIAQILNKIGYTSEIRRIEAKNGLRLTHIRKFPSEGRMARFSRKLERLFK